MHPYDTPQFHYLCSKTYELLSDIHYVVLQLRVQELIEALEQYEKAGFKPNQPRIPT